MDLGLKILSILATIWMTPYFAMDCICEMLRAAYRDFSKGCVFWTCPRTRPTII